MSACEKCWGDAFRRGRVEWWKSQAEHYRDLLEERKANPCSTEQQRGFIPEENEREAHEAPTPLEQW